MFDTSAYYASMPDNWQIAWLNRELPPLQLCIDGLAIGCVVALLWLGALTLFTKHDATARLKEEPSRRVGIIAAAQKRYLIITRYHLSLAASYIFYTGVLYLADTIIVIKSFSREIASQAGTYTKDKALALALSSVGVLVIFLFTFFIIPLVQMVLVAKLLRRIGKKRGSEDLSDFTPEARFVVTHIAQFWCVASFFLTALWAPMSDGCFWRGIALQASWSSSLSWLQISWALNFRSEELEEVKFSSSEVVEILRMFRKSATAVYRPSEKCLPQYGNQPPQNPSMSSQR